MNTLYETTDVLAKLRSYLTPFFEGFTRPTTKKLIWLVIAMIAVGGARSVRNLHTDFLAGLDIVSLNALYHALSYAKHPLKRAFARTTALMMLKAVPAAQKNQPLFLSVDDTLIPKFGKKFDWVGTLFDHAAHDGRPYKNGHCLVCIALSVPVGLNRETGRARYLSVPLLVQVWQKDGPSKLQIAHDLLYELRDSLLGLGSFVLLTDSWYPKAPLLSILDEWPGLKFVGAVRSDTALFELPPKHTGKRGRPRKRGQRLSIDDFVMKVCGIDGYIAGCRPVITRLFGDCQVTAFVTCPSGGTGSRRLYLSTLTCHDTKRLVSCAVQFCDMDNAEFLPLFFYRNRWMIEVIFLEMKTFWSLESYMVRNAKAIDLLLNLIVVAYALTKILPHLDNEFGSWQGLSSQQIRFKLGKLISRRVFLYELGLMVQTAENKSTTEKSLYRQLVDFTNIS